ncbi:hypothetical protein [Enterococcus faecium]|uniref:hypothetical protein n=1 Tax=Enterococcus faecium TaxID=1352 RepID=UPI001650D03C|nr:hypothetical protein [Enterococcus faecium]MCE3072269.1 hypothetical protein [Enterococcus faecium]MCE3104148.1 hypothetical protein [Enterococcus faecium]MCE3148904.1 hypothetical protein [Enterococcus faecium]MCE3159514.1 hypothetical protein [Enterococcus faecium]MCE3162443.1 hypothetical protein [Enterococcus faecium]
MKVYVVRFGNKFYRSDERSIGNNTLFLVDFLQNARWFDNLEEANQVSRRLGGLTQVYELVTVDHEEVE